MKKGSISLSSFADQEQFKLNKIELWIEESFSEIAKVWGWAWAILKDHRKPELGQMSLEQLIKLIAKKEL